MFFKERVQKRQFSRNTIEIGTGKTWDEWASIVDSRSTGRKDLSTVMEFLVKEHGLSQQWARTIASYYVLQ